MTEPAHNTRRWQLPKLSIVPLLAIALSFSLLFSAYLLLGLNVGAQGFSPTAPHEPGADIAPGATAAASSDVEVLMVQLATTQSQLQNLASLLHQKGQSLGYSPSGSASHSDVVYDDIPALWAEIEQLYQIMQPLMTQVEAASAASSSRPTSELIALRTRVNTIHQRLVHLLARVEAANARNGVPVHNSSWTDSSQWGTAAGASTGAASSDPVKLQQLYQNLSEMNNLLQQLQRQETYP